MNAEKLNGMVEDIRDAMIDYQVCASNNPFLLCLKSLPDIDATRHVRQEFPTRRESRLITFRPRELTSEQESADRDRLDRMYHTPDAGYQYGNNQGCLRGTRKEVLSEIGHWLDSEHDQRVFWLNGLAGTGKSTIAQTFAKTSFADGKLGASFFCSRDFADRSNLKAIFPTLAFQLAYQYPNFRMELLEVLKANPHVERESLFSQMGRLIVGPLKSTNISTLIVIDALDECKDEKPESAILSILSRYVNEIPGVKFFITGRPETGIRSGFRLESLAQITEVLKLHEVKPEAIDSDIKLYFRTQLSNVVKNRSDCNLTEDWVTSSEIEILCKKAGGYFIYASTVVKFVSSESYTPDEQLAKIISFPQSTVHEGRSGVDLLYTQVLEQVVDIDVDDKELYTRRRTILGAVVLIINPLSSKALSDLLAISNISSPLRSLHSLLLVPNDKATSIRVFHKSFPDFITDQNRCKDQRFFVEPKVHHAEILLLCLKLMKERLRRNICHLDDHAILSEVKDLSARKKDFIGDALKYACQFWTKHLLGVPNDSPHVEEVQRGMDQFFRKHLLQWIEVLILIGSLGVGVSAMNEVEQWCTLVSIIETVCYEPCS